MMTLVIGGAASGKSAYAESLICGEPDLCRDRSSCEDRNASENRSSCEDRDFARKLYIATMQPFGKEAEDRIRKHRAMRANKGFETLECFTARSIRERSLPSGAAVLLEDLGNLCANELFSEAAGDGLRLAAETPEQLFNGTLTREKDECLSAGSREQQAAEAVTAAITALREKCGNLVVVTNEVFSGGAEYEGETLSYLRMLGQVNNALAAMADRVTEVQCGVPVMIKNDFETCADRVDRKIENDAEPGNRPGTGVEEKRPGMVFVTGPMFSGKRAAAEMLFGKEIFEKEIRSISEVQALAAGCRDEKELEQLAEKLSEYDVVISTETGCGVVPMDPAVRDAREKAGRLNCLLAARAETVIRVFCGIPQVMRGVGRPSVIKK